MPAQSKRARAARAKRQTGADRFTATVNSPGPENESESDWQPSDSEGHAEESDDVDAYGIMQLWFARHFKSTLHKKDPAREPIVSFMYLK